MIKLLSWPWRKKYIVLTPTLVIDWHEEDGELCLTLKRGDTTTKACLTIETLIKAWKNGVGYGFIDSYIEMLRISDGLSDTDCTKLRDLLRAWAFHKVTYES